MTRLVKCQLVDERGHEIERCAVVCAKESRIFSVGLAVQDAYKQGLLGAIDVTDLKVFKSKTAYDSGNSQPLDFFYPLEEIDEEEELVVEVPVGYERGDPSLDAMPFGPVVLQSDLRSDLPHLARQQLLHRIYEEMESNGAPFILLTSPSGSGKTSLLSLFTRRYTHLRCHVLEFFYGDEVSAYSLTRNAGIDVFYKEAHLSDDEYHVFMIDDAEEQFHDNKFWTAFIKDGSSWLPHNTRFIISAHHALKPGIESPAEFQSLVTFDRKDFLLSDTEVNQFLSLPTSGLPSSMTKPNFVKLLVHECNGLVGALRVSITWLIDHFRRFSDPSETELIEYFLSYAVLKKMERCFGTHRNQAKTRKLKIS